MFRGFCRLQDALEALKHRKSTQSRPPISRSPSVELIRDSDILVPPSSSPAPTPQQSKYFASKIPQKNGGSDSLDKRTDAGKHEKYPSLNGSPSDVLRAIHRHSPQPLRRPKPRYVDPDEEESPVKPTPAAPSMISSVRQPSLVHAAQSVRDDHEEKMIQRLSSQFPNVEQSTISSLLRKYPGNPDRAINQIHYANQMKAEQESYTSAKNATSKRSSPLPVPASPVASNSKSKKKNENSTIYANRKRNRRSNDSEEEFSGGGSEDDFSDGEDGRKRRRGEDDEPDAEDAALKAFNEDSVETLTGTIGMFWRWFLGAWLTSRSSLSS